MYQKGKSNILFSHVELIQRKKNDDEEKMSSKTKPRYILEGKPARYKYWFDLDEIRLKTNFRKWEHDFITGFFKNKLGKIIFRVYQKFLLKCVLIKNTNRPSFILANSLFYLFILFRSPWLYILFIIGWYYYIPEKRLYGH